jgi:hypothetical protein
MLAWLRKAALAIRAIARVRDVATPLLSGAFITAGAGERERHRQRKQDSSLTHVANDHFFILGRQAASRSASRPRSWHVQLDQMERTAHPRLARLSVFEETRLAVSFFVRCSSMGSSGNRSKSAVRLLCGAAILSAACGAPSGQGAASPVLGSSTEPETISPALAKARREKTEAEALVPPAVPTNLDQEHALRFVSGPLRSWMQARVARSEGAASAYADVTRQNSVEELTGLLELAELWQTFGDVLKATVVAAIPTNIARDPETKAAYLNAVLEVTQRPFDEARGALQRCVKRADETGRSSAGVACKERLSRLPERIAAPSDAAVGSVARGSDPTPKRVVPLRPKVSASQPSPCVFAGSLESNEFELWTEPRAGRRVARVWRLDLASLSLPEKEGQPVRVNAIWPVQGSYWLAGANLPIVLRARHDLVKAHVWLDAGTPMHVFGPNAGMAQAMRPRSWAVGSEPSFSQRIACTELGLAGSVERTYPELKNPRSFKGLLELSAAPGKPAIAKLQVTKSETFEVLARSGTWCRIAARAIDGQLPFSFDAWTKNADDGEPGFGMIGLLREVNPTHVSTAALKAFASPSAQGASVTIAPEVWFQVGEPKSGFVPIQISELSGPERGDLWIQQAELSHHARSLSP